MTDEFFSNDEMLTLTHTEIDKAIDVLALAIGDMQDQLENGTNNLMELSPEEKNMYIICKCYTHMYNNYYSDESIIKMVNEQKEH